MARILIVGGGFAGLFTALNLGQYRFEQAPEIVLIDRAERFVFAPLLYELISGELSTWEVAPRFVDLLEGTQVRFVQAEAVGFDLDNRVVKLAGGGAEGYDLLVLAAGGQTPVEIVPGAREHALPFRTLEDAQTLIARLKQALEAGADPVRVSLVGAGASGVELACKLADTLQRQGSITLFDREAHILSEFDETARTVAREALEQRGVRLQLETRIATVNARGLEVLTGDDRREQHDAEVVLWTVGTSAPKLLESLNVAKGSGGRAKVEQTLQLADYPEVFALGDLAAGTDASGQTFGASAQLAYQQAQFCAWNLWALLQHKPLLPMRYQSLGQLLGLGIDGGVATLLGMPIRGELAYLVRRLAYLYRMPTDEHRLKVALHWASRPLVRWLDSLGAANPVRQ